MIERGSENSHFRRVYLDPDQSYVPLRVTTQSSEITMQYARGQQPTWIPSSWSVVVNAGSGKLDSQSENRLVSVDLGVPVTEETFRIKYPPGTRVGDGRKGGIPTVFVVSDTGEFIPYRSEVARGAADGGWARWPLIFAAIGAAVLGGALLLWRRAAGGV